VKVLGIDLSLTSTGLGIWRSGAGMILGTVRLRPPAPFRDLARMRWICEQIGLYTEPHMEGATLAVLEGPSYGNQGSGRQAGHHERAGLWWLVREKLDSLGVPVAVAPPATVKKYATGSGNAGKDEVLKAALRRNPDFDGGNDEADAMWLAAMGADHLGRAPIVPESHRAVLAKVNWPNLIGDES
jgi:crossover junction endodeoxyribonuclease RuvC